MEAAVLVSKDATLRKMTASDWLGAFTQTLVQMKTSLESSCLRLELLAADVWPRGVC